MSQIKVKEKWLRLTEETNALDYLEKAFYYIRETEGSIIAWKWVILSLFGALYGFAICACKGSSPDWVTCKTKKGRKLIGFDEALKICQDPNRMKMFIFSKHLKLSKNQKESIRKLHKDYRNYFEHYIPTTWSIEVHGMPQIALDVLAVIRFLALETGNCTCLTKTQIKRIKSIAFQSKKILKKSFLYTEARQITKFKKLTDS